MNAPPSKFWKSSVKIRPHYERISKIPSCGERAWKKVFFIILTFLALVTFWSLFMFQKIARVKKIDVNKKKSVFFMPINHAKEFLKSVHNEALFSHLFSRTLIEVRSMNFKAKNLRMVFFYSEYLYVSMVEPAHESLARWLVYYKTHSKFFCPEIFARL